MHDELEDINVCRWCKHYEIFPHQLCFKTVLSVGKHTDPMYTCESFKLDEDRIDTAVMDKIAELT